MSDELKHLEFKLIRKPRSSSNMVINSNDRLHYQKKASITAKIRSIGKLYAIGIKSSEHTKFSKLRPCTLDVIIYSPTKRRLDPPNLYPTVKALIDGMTDGGFWTDDNHEVIKKMSFSYGGLSGEKDVYIFKLVAKGLI